MLYPKNLSRNLDLELFKNPTSEYRGTPFWSWNCELKKEQLFRQIEYLKEMGMGGFHIHSRTGLATPYLSDEFMEIVKACVDKARSEKMLAWLYDEDRWPSGFAGGLVTSNPEYRSRHLLFTPDPYSDKTSTIGQLNSTAAGKRMENGTLLAKYEIAIDADGFLKSYRILKEGESGENVWYAYLEINGESPWYNNQSYVNTLDKKAIDEFIKITYEKYKNWVGDDFGTIIPAIFTDEPQFAHKTTLGFAHDRKDVFLPWTDDLPETFFNTYDMHILEGLPELFWELPEGRVSLFRYRYHDHVTQRFTEAFVDNCGAWCRANGIKLTGHMMEEVTLRTQTAALGEAMRAYRGFDLPGIDILCDYREYNTAKQAQSAVHQFECEGMLSELYGVTNWDFDFRGHKLQGDWQAALGVTVRVHHLSWVSMKGESKRDYPASINYQSPWFREYKLVEDHFSRLNSALTRGNPLIRIGVIHPVESYWLYWGPSEQTNSVREQLDANHSKLTEWLLFGLTDFDFISESLLPDQCENGSSPLKVGVMEYDTIIVPGCHTLRKTTLERLTGFLKAGGKLIIMGKDPSFIDAVPSENNTLFDETAIRIPFENHSLMEALSSGRIIDIKNKDGTRTDNLVTQIRKDGDSLWAFIANGKKPVSEDISIPQELTIRIKDYWTPEIFETINGEIYIPEYDYEDTTTVIRHTIYTHDSILIKLTRGQTERKNNYNTEKAELLSEEGMFGKVDIRLSEPNCLLLDIAEYAFDDGEYMPEEEILRIDNKYREKLDFPLRMASVAQPWVSKHEDPSHFIKLKFTITSEIDVLSPELALEDADSAEIHINGVRANNKVTGWYVDESIQKVSIPDIKKGINILELILPFGKQTNLEWCYLLGNFGVKVNGYEKIITPPVRKLAFGDIVSQGLPFYGGNITYILEVQGNGNDVYIKVPFYRGALLAVDVDGTRAGTIAFDPYTLTIPSLSKGTHSVEITLFGNRINSFGPVHNCDKIWKWHGPNAWRTTGDRWSYEYVLKPTGILKSPAIVCEKPAN